ncbi:glutaredoxin domain-containing protein [uncultured Clostridium sp.]|uniref:glutaredoxin family protein n=1 Tax=uncultured Clostridium sp. TaxID=59620 RepID=UPI0026344599|nr:glutaredoxin domain-containing protein [uncultured Clostridium sp.]
MVKVYSTSWCPGCIKLKKYLDMNNVEYSTVNVADAQEDRLEVIKVSGQKTVPVLDFNGEVIVGFDKKKIDTLIKTVK